MARQAVWLAERASHLARRDPSPRLHALIAAREAIARARLGDGEGFRNAIARSRRELDRSLGDGDPAWLGFVRPAEITVHEAKGLAYLGNGDDAIERFRDSLDDEHLSRRNLAIYRAQLAATLARSGDLTGAVSEAMMVLPVLEERVSSPRTLTTLRPARVAAAQVGAEEFCARFDALTRAVPAGPKAANPAA
jgi:hypothetical protein